MDTVNVEQYRCPKVERFNVNEKTHCLTGVFIKPLKLSDFVGFNEWGSHSDIRFYKYNAPSIKPGGLYKIRTVRWIFKRQVPLLRWIYAVKNADNRLLGYLKATRKNIFQNKAELSIVLDPNVLEKGFGTLVLMNFIEICFETLKFKEVWLRVSAFNSRADHVYKKIGFERYQTCIEPFEDQQHHKELLQQFPATFFLEGSKLMTRFHYMRLEKEQFYAIHTKAV